MFDIIRLGALIKYAIYSQSPLRSIDYQNYENYCEGYNLNYVTIKRLLGPTLTLDTIFGFLTV
jgi:hypothetical protein